MIRRLAPGGAQVFAAVFVGVAVARSAWPASPNGLQPPLAQTPPPGPYPWPTVEAPGGVTPAPPSPTPPKPPAAKTPAPTEKRVEPAVPAPVAPKAAPAAPPAKVPEPAAPKPPATPAGTPSQFPSAAPTAPRAPIKAPPPPAVEPVPATETSVGAWGEALVQINRDHQVRARLPWLALELRHRPISWLQLVAGAELEEANRFGLEQVQVQILPHPAFSLRFGLVLLPLGIINLWTCRPPSSPSTGR